MKLRVYTIMNYIDIEASTDTTIDHLEQELDTGNILVIKTIQNTTVYLNTINIVGIEVLNMPPIEPKNA